MIPDSAELKALLDFAGPLARHAGEITNRYFKGSFVAERKADNSFVTAADREAEKYLRARIQDAFSETRFSVKKRAKTWPVKSSLDSRSDRRHLFIRAWSATLRSADWFGD
jgi:3''-Phosphoadenosine 5''-phosphosulfate (PAPS) 3''-phosphatase